MRQAADVWAVRGVQEGGVKYGFQCTIHNFKFDFGDLPKGFEAWQVTCPLCQMVELDKAQAQIAELTGHRDALLKVIDLKRTLLRGKDAA